MRDSILQVFLISYLLTCWIWPFAFALCLVNAIRDREPVLIRCSKCCSRRTSIFLAGLSLMMMVTVPCLIAFYFMLSQ